MYEVLNAIRDDKYPNSFTVTFNKILHQETKSEAIKDYLVMIIQKIIAMENLINAKTLVKVLKQEHSFGDQKIIKFTIVKILTFVDDNTKVRKLISNKKYDFCIQLKKVPTVNNMLEVHDIDDIKLELMLR